MAFDLAVRLGALEPLLRGVERALRCSARSRFSPLQHDTAGGIDRPAVAVPDHVVADQAHARLVRRLAPGQTDVPRQAQVLVVDRVAQPIGAASKAVAAADLDALALRNDDLAAAGDVEARGFDRPATASFEVHVTAQLGIVGRGVEIGLAALDPEGLSLAIALDARPLDRHLARAVGSEALALQPEDRLALELLLVVEPLAQQGRGLFRLLRVLAGGIAPVP
jgi:hypothetical protein